jgi:peptidoglycan/xylan/chitin deacetylase (PgdA/CDA1 family)
MTKRLTYTFDNGPWPGATEKVLDFLDRRGIKSSFFVVGQQFRDESGRRLVEEAHSRGHWIGNHTMTHGEPLGRNGGIERVRSEIGETQAMLEGLAHSRKFFRPNGGGSMGPHLLSAEAVDYLLAERFTVVTWTSAPGDWIAPHRPWLEKALADVEGSDWTVLVLHDRFIAEMMDTLEHFQTELERRGVEIVQDFPRSCMIVEGGAVNGPLGAISPVQASGHAEPGARR